VTGSARLGQAEFTASQTRMGKLCEKDLDVALDLANDSGLALPATEQARALILEVFENK
jgi:3-hydroxyisobutyrate dehydrogenase-like beta-hydroxyacid dehydrogenase